MGLWLVHRLSPLPHCTIHFHLVRLCSTTQSIIVSNSIALDHLSEEIALQLQNHQIRGRTTMLLTFTIPSMAWGLNLRDLMTR